MFSENAFGKKKEQFIGLVCFMFILYFYEAGNCYKRIRSDTVHVQEIFFFEYGKS